MSNFVTHLESAIDGTHFPRPGTTAQPDAMHKDRPLWVKYDLKAVARALTPEKLISRAPTLWRYRERLPVEKDEHIVTLGEGMTPLLPAPRLGNLLGLPNLYVKDDSQLPTGSFKSRGQTMAISMAKSFGITRVAIPTAGNAGGAMSAYAARAGMQAYVFMPSDTPVINQYEAVTAGAKVFLVDGLINDCGKIVRAGIGPMKWWDISTLKEPYRIEGKKTMGLELAEQFNWQLPDVILYPTGGGTGLIGMWKAFKELREMGWLKSDKMPKMVCVQSKGCAPIVRAFEAGERFAPLFENAATVASGIRVPAAVGDFMIIDAIRESGGTAIAVNENEIVPWMQKATSAEGISFCPESSACVAAAVELKKQGWLTPDQKVIVYNCGAGQKYPGLIPLTLPRLPKDIPSDWSTLG